MKIVIGLLKLILKIVAAPVVVVLTVAIWMCVGIVYVCGLVLGLLSTVVALLGVAVMITYSLQDVYKRQVLEHKADASQQTGDS